MSQKISLQIRSPDKLNLRIHTADKQSLSVGVGNSGTRDYEKLYNKPSINGTELVGDYTLACKSDTTEGWNRKLGFIPQKGEIIVYADEQDGAFHPRIKVGDGKAYLIDLPFLAEENYEKLTRIVEEHINNMDVHVTSEEKEFWNAKLNCQEESEELIFTRE